MNPDLTYLYNIVKNASDELSTLNNTVNKSKNKTRKLGIKRTRKTQKNRK